MSNDEIKKQLKHLLLDENFRTLNSMLEAPSFNIFDVLRVSRTEIRHSNVLSWLLDPCESHTLGKGVLSRLNAYIASEFCNVADDTSFKLLTMKYNDIVVLREWQNIDILIESESEKYVLCIENKIDTQDHDGQLNKYYKIIEGSKPEYTKIFLYLTPEGLAPINDENSAWFSISYADIVEIIEQTIRYSDDASEPIKFIRAYIDTLRREIMNDYELKELCRKLYNDHKTALDLLFENRPDALLNASVVFTEWCAAKAKNHEIIFDSQKSSKSYTRFRTKDLDKILPLIENCKSGWNTDNHYFYEIYASINKNGNISYGIQLAFSSQNLPEDERKKYEEIIKKITNKDIKKQWQWKTVYKSTAKIIKSQDLEDIDSIRGTVHKELDKLFKDTDDKIKKLIK